MSIAAPPMKVARTPKITNRRSQTSLRRALERAEGNNDKPLAEHIKAVLNGAVPLNPPNVKKVKK